MGDAVVWNDQWARGGLRDCVGAASAGSGFGAFHVVVLDLVGLPGGGLYVLDCCRSAAHLRRGASQHPQHEAGSSNRAQVANPTLRRQSPWVRPVEPTTLSVDLIKLFHKRVGEPSEMCIHEADPFGILFMDLDDWLTEHRSHKPVMKLEEGEGT